MKKLLLTTLGASFLAMSAPAEIASELNYQATVTDDAGALIAEAAPESYDVTIRIYSASSGGTLLWSEVHTTSIFKGRFSVILGTGTQVGAEPHGDLAEELDEENHYVETTLLERVGGATPKTLLPRQKLVATATALRAKVADSVANDAITEAMIAPGSITSVSIKANSINAGNLAPDSVGSSEIATGAVGASEIDTGAVNSAEIADGSVKAAEIATNAVNFSEIASGAVRSSEILDGEVKTADLADRAVNSVKILDNSITSSDIGPSAVGVSEIAAGAVRSSEILDGEVKTADLADGAVTVAKAEAALAAPHMFSANNTKGLWTGKTNDSYFTFTPAHNIPSSARGVILRVFVKGVVANLARQTGAICFADKDGNYRPDDNGTALTIPPYFANSVCQLNPVNEYATGIAFVPLRTVSEARRIYYRHMRASQWDTGFGGVSSSNSAESIVALIGYY